ncbi:MAG: UDP-glucose 4-epimerase GalE [Lentisphaeria bacterium]|nr:UDP-glucose 4-epimerase GalE [Lentisphaeria bacterium]NQZ71334.1 UDP-glucose 4-epimerase GalE [Lentisphaeria bacterium]
MAILVTGGAGFIGSVTVEALVKSGEDVVVLDNLSRGFRKAVNDSIPFYKADISDAETLGKIFSEHEIDACIHFAAYAYVGESVTEPRIYFQNNAVGSINFFDILIENNIKNVVFSSTCATYGEPVEIPINESHPQNPANPYGWTKFILERQLEAYDDAYGLKHVALRYFNAAGATENRGELHDPEPHILPNIIFAAMGKKSLKIFGNDYPTIDGTCVRDYIHVADLADAHIKAVNHLRNGGDSEKINLGNGHGYSVLQCIEAAEKVTGKTIEYELQERRAGDPSHLVADASKAHELLGWKPQFPSIEQIIQSAWDFFESHPNGYE